MGLKEKILEIDTCVKRLPAPEAVTTLLEIANENHPIIAQHAVAGLGHLVLKDREGYVRPVQAMMTAMMDKKRHATVHRSAAITLAQIGRLAGEEARQMILHALDVAIGQANFDNDVTVNLVWAIGELGDDARAQQLKIFREAMTESAGDGMMDPISEWIVDLLAEAIEKIAARGKTQG